MFGTTRSKIFHHTIGALCNRNPFCYKTPVPSLLRRSNVLLTVRASSSTPTKFNLHKYPIHFCGSHRGGTAIVEPEYNGDPSWFEGYLARHDKEGHGGRLITMYSFDDNWTDETEMKSTGGDQVTMCLSGKMNLHQEQEDGSMKCIPLSTNEYIVTPPGKWITVDTKGPTSMLMMTPFEGTEVRPRSERQTTKEAGK